LVLLSQVEEVDVALGGTGMVMLLGVSAIVLV